MNDDRFNAVLGHVDGVGDFPSDETLVTAMGLICPECKVLLKVTCYADPQRWRMTVRHDPGCPTLRVVSKIT